MVKASPKPLLEAVPDPADPSVSEQPVALLILKNVKTQRTVSRVMSASGAQAIVCPDLSAALDWIDRVNVELLIYDYELDFDSPDSALARLSSLVSARNNNGPALVLLSERRAPEDLARIFDNSFPGNVIAKVGGLESTDLLVSARKLFEQDIFGVDKYLRWGSIIHEQRVSSSDQRSAYLDKLSNFLSELGCRNRLIGELVTVADEFLMNAIYDAPVDERGTQTHVTRSRRDVIKFSPERAAAFSFGSDGKHVALGCRDLFGSLDPQQVMRSLSRCLRKGDDQISDKPGGAGLGLYLIYQYVDHLVVNIEQGQATEFIGVVDISLSPKERRTAGKSINVFTL